MNDIAGELELLIEGMFVPPTLEVAKTARTSFSCSLPLVSRHSVQVTLAVSDQQKTQFSGQAPSALVLTPVNPRNEV